MNGDRNAAALKKLRTSQQERAFDVKRFAIEPFWHQHPADRRLTLERTVDSRGAGIDALV